MEALFLQSHSEASGLVAVLEEDTGTAYLYLLESAHGAICAHAVAYCIEQPATTAALHQARLGRSTPPLLHAWASPEARLPQGSLEEFEFIWAKDGCAVALRRSGRSIAFVSSRQKHGYSRAVSISCPIAEPWDDSAYNELFAGEA
jgi:hypothetical protein